MLRSCVFISLFFFLFTPVIADTLYVSNGEKVIGFVIQKDTCQSTGDTIIKGKTKAEALLWWLLGGVVGLHRIYLGTSPVVPVFYALTLGGGMGVLFVSDLIAILVTKDINRFADNKNIIMWIDEKDAKKPPSAD
jgi:hypothetical protein